MVRYMSSDQFRGQTSSRSGRRRPHRHSFNQTQKLEAYFKICQHPNERQRSQLGREVGLTPTQIKFWFQNKRTLTKAQNGRLEGNALRQENERMKYENLAIIEALNGGLCMVCKGLSSVKEDKQQIIEQLKIENMQLNEEHERLRSLLAASEVSPLEINSPDTSNRSVPKDLVVEGLSLDHKFCSKNLNDLTSDHQLMEIQEFDLSHLVEAATNAINELSNLMSVEQLWIKDPADGKYIIHRDNYEKTFLRINHLNSSQGRFESSKEEGIVRMNGPQLVAMLQDSTKRLDFFPTILTKAVTMKHFGTGCGTLNGTLQMVYEQMHVLSPLVPPRDFYFIRYCEQIDDGVWIIAEVSYDLINDYKKTSPFRSWKFPSGCLIKDMSNGYSKITWVEHVEVDDKTLTHHLYRNLILRGLGYGADRWILSLQKMCDRFASQIIEENAITQEIEAIRMSEGRRSIMNLTHRMMKDLCGKLCMKHKMDMPDQLSQPNNSETRVNIYKSTGLREPNGLIITVATSTWIPLSSQAAFDFFTNMEKRSLWDALFDGNPVQEIATIRYGNDPGNCISIIQPLVPHDTNTVVLQESYADLQEGVIVYAPVHKKFMDMMVSGVDSYDIPILPSGLIISNDGHDLNTKSDDGASSSNATHHGSLVTVVLQIISCDNSSFEQLNAIVSSTIHKIKYALNSSSLM